MTTVEQILLRLGIDNSQVGPGMDQFKRGVGDAMGSATKWYENAGRPARAFRQVLNQITTESPALGTALRFAINPVVGALMAAVVIFQKVRAHLKEINEELDRMATFNAKPLASIAEQAEKVADALAKMTLAAQKWAESQKQSDVAKMEKTLDKKVAEIEAEGRSNEKLMAQRKQLALDKIRMDYESGRISQQEMVKRQNETESSFAKQERDAAIALQKRIMSNQVITRNGLAAERRIRKRALDEAEAEERNEGRQKRIFGVQGNIQDQEEMLKEAQRKKEEWDKKVAAYQDYSKWGKQTTYFGGEAAAEAATARESQKMADEVKKWKDKLHESREALSELNREQEKASDKVQEERRLSDEARKAWEKANDAVGKTTIKLKELQAVPAAYSKEYLQRIGEANLPTVEQLATMYSIQRMSPIVGGGYRQVLSPAMQIAREIQALENDALMAAAWGNKGRHDADVMRAQGLRDMLREAGIISPEDAARKSESHLATLAATVKGGAMDVNVKNAD